MKAYVDIEQSKKLAEILPLESADMCFANDGTAIKIDANSYNVRKLMWEDYVVEVIPCWSLAALVDILPEVINFDDDENDYAIEIIKEDGLYYLRYGNPFEDKIIEVEPQQNFVDTCVAMIEKLNELKLL